MKIIIFGLGSMGKRRARCLQNLGHNDLFGFDIRVDRQKEGKLKEINVTSDLRALPLKEADAFFICTPPDQHEPYLRIAIEYAKPCFVEASVLIGELEEINDLAKNSNVLISPSCTMLFHSAIKKIKQIVDNKEYGKVTNFSYHCGQYLPDWHPWENVKDYYVSNYLTGGCREIVPFELTWIVEIFGIPRKGNAHYGSTMNVGAEVSDTYAISLQFEDIFGSLLVDVTSRYAVRTLLLNFENAQIQWSWDLNCLRLYNALTQSWNEITLDSKIKHADGYNQNINEDMYIEETASFLNTIKDKTSFPNTLEKDIKILKLLEHLEKNMENSSLEILHKKTKDNELNSLALPKYQTFYEYCDRLHDVIPGGAHTYSRGDDQFPHNVPSILEKGKGAYLWDPYENKYLDYGMGLRSVTLGYANERVNQAAFNEIQKGINLPRPSTVELKAAELMVNLIPSAHMVKFAKNGSNVTTAAVKIARAYTGKKYICIPRQHPFFSFDDWFIGTTAITKGVPSEISSLSLNFDYGDIESLQALFDKYPEQIAGVILEPATLITPCSQKCNKFNLSCNGCPNQSNNFLHQVRRLCTRENALFILDEMITGFRWHLSGAQTFYGVEPDLSTFGKGMANGFSLAALVGKREYMELGSIRSINQERLFLLSTTHGGEMSALGAFIETVQIYKENDVINYIWTYGEKLFKGINSISQELGLIEYFYMIGTYPLMNYATKDREGNESLAFRTLFVQEMASHGVLISWISISLAHQDTELQITLNAVKKSLKKYVEALEIGIDKYLKSPVIKPVFRKYN